MHYQAELYSDYVSISLIEIGQVTFYV